MIEPAKAFAKESRENTLDPELNRILGKALGSYHLTVGQSLSRWTDWQAARNQTRTWKYDAINRLDTLLTTLEKRLAERGVEVHWAKDSAEALNLIDSLLERYQAHTVIKSKTMTTEEIGLNEHLEGKGMEVTESDLGEFIVQLRKEKPFHIVTPAMHLSKDSISRLFEEKLNISHTEDATELTLAARRHLRQKFLRADLGITGANFAVADPGLISITENEGNGVLSASSPRVHVSVMGLEKVLPSLEQLALFLPMLSHSGTGQFLTCYNSWIAGPRQPGEQDGPEALHLILLDNGRTKILSDPEQRETLHCIRCGACLNACPVFRQIGGHAYGTVYQGPIGSVISPNLLGLDKYGHLSFASSLCGRCADVCPVHIDLHHHLLENRRNQVERHPPSLMQAFAFRRFASLMSSPAGYRRAVRLAQFGLRCLHQFPVLMRLPGLRGWAAHRNLPTPPPRSFLESVAREPSP